MKSYTLIRGVAISLLFSFSTVSAQQQAGVKGGLNYSGLSGYKGGKTLNIHAGVFGQWNLCKNWKVQPELLWSAAKQKYTVNEGEGVTTQALVTHFASLPVIVRYAASSKVFIDAGPQLSFLISAKDVTAGGVKADVKRSLRNTDIALNAGAGYILSKKLELYLRYSHGFTDLTLYDNNTDGTRLWQAGLAFRFK